MTKMYNTVLKHALNTNKAKCKFMCMKPLPFILCV